MSENTLREAQAIDRIRHVVKFEEAYLKLTSARMQPGGNLAPTSGSTTTRGRTRKQLTRLH